MSPQFRIPSNQWRTVNFWSGGGGTKIFVKGLKGYVMAGMELGGPGGGGGGGATPPPPPPDDGEFLKV